MGVSRELISGVLDGTRWSKRKTQVPRFGFEWDTVVSVELGEERQTYGIEVHEDHSHVTNGIVTHNTGRWSSRLHQVPRDGTIRNIITAPPGWTFVQMDLSQAELRVIAIVARDPVMLDIFKRGGDIHWQVLMAIIENGGGEYALPLMKTAKEFLGSKRKIGFADALEVVSNMDPKSAIEIWDGWKEGRKKAKGTSFGYSYGQSALGFIDYAKTKYGFTPTLEESTSMRNAYFTKFYRLPDWHERQKKLVRQDGMVKNLLGRKRHLPGIYSKDRSVVAECERQAINSPIQGFIGDYKACILIELHETLSRTNFRICGEVHDSILMWIRTEQLESILPRVKRIAENPQLARHLKFPIKLTVDFEVGRWGGGKTWKPTED
jgi:DNA polymerase-1